MKRTYGSNAIGEVVFLMALVCWAAVAVHAVAGGVW